MGITTSKLKSLNETVSGLLAPTEQVDKARGYVNSLTAKARQVICEKKEEEEDEDEKEETPAEEEAEDKAEMLMKKLAAKALKRAKKKAATNEEVELAEKAAPGYEDWASDPKVKRSFKKQYGKRWKQVMYGRSWNMKKMDEETEQLDEGSLGMRKGIRLANAVMNKGKGKLIKRSDAAELRSISKVNKEAGGTGRISGKPMEYRFSDKEFKVMKRHAAKGVKGKNSRPRLKGGLAEAIESKLSRLAEGSRGIKRLGRIMKSVTKNYQQGKAMIGKQGKDAAASKASLVSGLEHMMKKSELRKQISSRTRAAASRKRIRAGLSPKLPYDTTATSANTTGGYEYTENPKRVPKAIKTYRNKKNMYR